MEPPILETVASGNHIDLCYCPYCGTRDFLFCGFLLMAIDGDNPIESTSGFYPLSAKFARRI